MKKVRAVTVIYEDGSTEVFEPIEGFHRATRNYDKGAKKPEEAWLAHEIRWSER